MDYKNVINLVMEAGEILRENFGKINSIRQKDKNPFSVVTKVDTQTEEFLASKLKDFYPSIGFVGEEYGKRGNQEKHWLVDPIDGTGYLMRGIPLCVILLSLIDKKEIVFSIIYDFVRKDLYTAEKNCGAKLNGKSISVSSRLLNEAYLTIEADLNNPEALKRYTSLKQHYYVIETDSGLDYAWIASGKLDGRICLEPLGEDWDYAPGAFLIKEAGGIVKNIGSNTYNYKNHNFIATNNNIYQELIQTDIFK